MKVAYDSKWSLAQMARIPTINGVFLNSAILPERYIYHICRLATAEANNRIPKLKTCIPLLLVE